jgi:hypothetical protein
MDKTTTTLLCSLKGLEILHQERRGQVKNIVMELFNNILFHKSGPANKQHTNQSIKQRIYVDSLIVLNGNTTTLLFSLKGLEILHQGRRGQVKNNAMEHLNSIFRTSLDLLTSNISINQCSECDLVS